MPADPRFRCRRLDSDGTRFGRIRALLVGEFFDEGLYYLGKVESGFDARAPHQIRACLNQREAPPFKAPISEPGARFCEPVFRVPMEFIDFTDDGRLRRPALNRFALL